MFEFDYIVSDEDDSLEEWDDDGEEYEEEVLVDIGQEIKKKSFFGKFIFLSIFLLVCIGGGAYYISIPQGAALRAKIPANILAMIPTIPTQEKQAVDLSQTLNTDTNSFSAPPMPEIEGDDSFFDDSPVNVVDNNNTPILNFSPVPEGNQDDNNIPTIDFSSTDKTPWDDNDKQEEIAKTMEFVPAKSNTENASLSLNSDDTTPQIKSAEIVDLSDRLSALEKAVFNIEKNMISQQNLDNMHRQVKVDMDLFRKDMKKMSFSTKKYKAVSHGNTASSKKKISRKKLATKIKTVTWVLKSAQTGIAWLEEKGRSGSVRKVVIGDTVSGLGKIKSIDKKNGRWLVKGSNGSVGQ